jgi:hypothetical protein
MGFATERSESRVLVGNQADGSACRSRYQARFRKEIFLLRFLISIQEVLHPAECIMPFMVERLAIAIQDRLFMEIIATKEKVTRPIMVVVIPLVAIRWPVMRWVTVALAVIRDTFLEPGCSFRFLCIGGCMESI